MQRPAPRAYSVTDGRVVQAARIVAAYSSSEFGMSAGAESSGSSVSTSSGATSASAGLLSDRMPALSTASSGTASSAPAIPQTKRPVPIDEHDGERVQRHRAAEQQRLQHVALQLHHRR